MNFVQMDTGLLMVTQQLDASRCVRCRYLRGTAGEQKMANLPESRVEPAPPFSYCAVDCFGPWYVKAGRREVKRYGTLFTCMASRAIHIEVVHTMETDSFLQALRRVIARRGPIQELRSDQGTNFVGGENELKRSFQEMEIRGQRQSCLSTTSIGSETPLCQATLEVHGNDKYGQYGTLWQRL